MRQEWYPVGDEGTTIAETLPLRHADYAKDELIRRLSAYAVELERIAAQHHVSDLSIKNIRACVGIRHRDQPVYELLDDDA